MLVGKKIILFFGLFQIRVETSPTIEKGSNSPTTSEKSFTRALKTVGIVQLH